MAVKPTQADFARQERGKEELIKLREKFSPFNTRVTGTAFLAQANQGAINKGEVSIQELINFQSLEAFFGQIASSAQFRPEPRGVDIISAQHSGKLPPNFVPDPFNTADFPFINLAPKLLEEPTKPTFLSDVAIAAEKARKDALVQSNTGVSRKDTILTQTNDRNFKPQVRRPSILTPDPAIRVSTPRGRVGKATKSRGLGTREIDGVLGGQRTLLGG